MPTLSQVNLYYVLIILFLLSFSAFILSLGYTLYYYLHGRHNSKRPAHDPRDIAVNEAVKIVEAARSHAMAMLTQAHSEAKLVLEDSEEIHSTVKESFDSKMQLIGQKQLQAFDQMSHELVESYKAVLAQEKESSIRSLADISTSLKNELTVDVRSFKDRIQVITSETENHIKSDLEGQYSQITVHLTELKDNLKRISAEAEAQIRASMGGDTDMVKNEINNFAARVKQLSDETEAKIRGEITQEYEQAKGVIQNLSTDLRKVVEDTENELKQGVKAEYAQVRTELDAYKKDRYAKIDSVVRGMLEEVARDVLGKTMTAHDHEELIIRSLESIKKTTNLKEL